MACSLRALSTCSVMVVSGSPENQKSNHAVELLMCLLLVARSVLWLQRNHTTKIGKQVVRTFPAEFIQVFTHPNCRMVEGFLELQRKALSSKSADVCMYQWFSEHFRYTGIAHLSRRNMSQEGGPAMRLLEHLLNTIRTSSPEAKKLRYRMARRHPPETCCFVLVRCGSEQRIRTLEWYDIKNLSPSANGRRCHKLPRAHQTRKRPPKSCRHDKPFRDVFHSLESRYLIRKIEHRMLLDKCKKGRVHDSTCHLSLPQAFHDAYLHCLRASFAMTGFQGPLNIYDLKNASLLARWLAKAKAEIVWERLERCWSRGFVGHGLARLAKALPAPTQRKVVLNKIREYLALKGLPAQAMFIKVPDKALLNAVKKLVLGAIDNANLESGVKRWIKSKTHFTVSRMPVWKDKWAHAKHASQASLEKVESLPDEHVLDALAGHGFTRPTVNWKLEYRLSDRAKCSDLYKEVKQQFQKSGLASVVAKICPKDFLDAIQKDKRYCSQKRQLHLSQHKYETYTEPMKSMVESGAVVPDDKTKHIAWGMPIVAYHVLCLTFLALSPSWFIVLMSPLEANSLLLARMVGILGPKLARRFGAIPGACLIPSGYVTIKSKCFAVGETLGRVCNTSKHSCARKICSYSKWPKKLAWRRMNRGIDIVIKKYFPRCWSLGIGSSRRKTKKRFVKVESSPKPGDVHQMLWKKTSLVGVVADANQFYEEVEPAAAVEALGNTLANAASRGWRGVYVGRAKKRKGFLTADRPNPLSKFCFFDFQTLLVCFRAALAVPFVTFGHVVARMQGLPIGGLCSKAATSALLTSQEERWFRHVKSRQQNLGFELMNGPIEASCLHLRYVDDVLLVSKLWCKGCLLFWLKQCYSVSFEACSNIDEICWLDMILHCPQGVVRPKKNHVTVPPPWGSKRTCLRPIFFNCLRRVCLISSDGAATRLHMMRVLLDFAKYGWSIRHISSVVFTTFRRPYQDILLFLRKCMRNAVFRQLLREVRVDSL